VEEAGTELKLQIPISWTELTLVLILIYVYSGL